MEELKVGVNVKIVSCGQCPMLVDKIGRVTEVVENGVKLSFGRGRPQKNRPEIFKFEEVAIVG